VRNGIPNAIQPSISVKNIEIDHIRDMLYMLMYPAKSVDIRIDTPERRIFFIGSNRRTYHQVVIIRSH
jgi:hypothetical protein